ncbi:glutathione reductase [Amylolactobacillus amylotrophicus DSM 20534]|uniref:Glutathione reductase n=3 Tax=Lactobacillaceae TaxID=33958 RepID=A0A0R1YKA5_9LACO|nr:glutathione reductase [Amylolactobacillus amylotrophicus DSM 20534]KRM42309.1 glutathione reductase [Amylolactobacillus amylophilus DSM 20533 = JCM 1125]
MKGFLMEKFDEIVIGAGPGGVAAASRLQSAGHKVMIVENNLYGGTCPNFGCDPKKMLYAAVETRQRARQMTGFGVQSAPEINWPELMEFKRGYTRAIPGGTEEGLKHSGVKTVHGTARFTAEHTIMVGDESYQATNFVIATGHRPAILDIPGKEYFMTSTDFLDLDCLPDELIFVGGGFVSFELANIAHQAGATVHLIHHNERPLKRFDEEEVQQLVELMRDSGIDVQLNASPTEIRKVGNQFEVVLADGRSITADQVYAGTGRVANIEALDLAKANVEFSRRGVHVDQYLQTTNEHVFAIGDVTDLNIPKLTPIAGYMSRYLVAHILGKSSVPFALPVVPEITFSTTELAQVGVTTDAAKADSKHYQVKDLDVTGWYSYNRTKEQVARVKVVIDCTNNLVVGAAVLSSTAEDLINQFMWLIDQHITHKELLNKVFAYPSVASDLQYFA